MFNVMSTWCAGGEDAPAHLRAADRATLRRAIHPRVSWCARVIALMLAHSSALASPEALRALTMDDASTWRTLEKEQLTADGHWLGYQLNPTSRTGGDATVVLKSTQDAKERRFDVGALPRGAGQLTVSASGQWAVFVRAEPVEGGQARERPVWAGRSLVVVELASGQTTELPCVQDFALDDREGRWLAFRSCDRAAPDAQEAPRDYGLPLTLRHLSSGRMERLGTAAIGFAFDPTARRLAWTETAGSSARLQVQELSTGHRRLVDRVENGSYAYLKWSPRGEKLAALRGGRAPSLLVFSRLGNRGVQSQYFGPDLWPNFPTDFEISTDPVRSRFSLHPMPARHPIVWRADEGGLFFGVRPSKAGASVKTTLDTRPPRGAPIIWHWADARLPAQKRQEADVDVTSSYLAYVSLSDGRFVQLADASLASVAPHGRSRYLLGYDDRAYEKESYTTGRVYRDYFLVSLRDGTRTPLRKRLQLPRVARLGVAPQLSPDGRSVLYLDAASGEYFAYDLTQMVERPMTRGLSTRFYDPQMLPAELDGWKEVSPLQGWSRDGQYALITDLYDVWAVPLHGKAALNLTGNGRDRQIRYTWTGLDIESEAEAEGNLERAPDATVDLSQAIYFRTRDLTTMETGLAERSPKDSRVHQLARGAAELRFVRAARAPGTLVRRETAVEPPNYYLSSAAWTVGAPLTDSNPQQRQIRWSPGARLLSYENAHGKPLKAVLHLPANYAAGRSYPTIVHLYELQASRMHRYASPLAGGGGSTLDVAFWTSRGYAVLKPDIRPRANRMTDAIVEDVDAAVEAAVESGVVDAERLALFGHSFGGYAVNVLLTRSSRFKAAVSVAGPTDWLSGYVDTYAKGVPFGFLAEGGFQPYITQPWWVDWEAARSNSPLFDAPCISSPLLLIHGRQDPQARFAHAEHLFNVLRRVGDKPVVLLEYPEEGHALTAAADVRDATQRQIEFYDHFLRDEPAPAWWASGVSSD